MGIIGNTQGVKMEARPKPKATARNPNSPSTGAAGVDDAAPGVPPVGDGVPGVVAAGTRGSAYPAGIATARAAAEGSTVSVAAPVHLDGTHILGLHVW